jgi:DNA polymerase III epsilon subunit family exonuclease
LGEIPLAVVDVETTGISPRWGHRIIELAILRIERGQVAVEYAQLFDPQRDVDSRISALTGITRAMVSGQPTFADQIDRIGTLLEGAVIVGHNVGFDLSFLLAEFQRCGRALFPQGSRPGPMLDTLRFARRQFGRGGNSLGRLAQRMGVEPVAAHRALADVHTTHRVFQALLQPHGGWQISLCDVLLLQGGLIGSPRQPIAAAATIVA